MSGELWRMAQAGITLLPSEVKKLAADYFALRSEVLDLRKECAYLRDTLTALHNEPDESRRR
jgi:hypothetical protein